MFSKLTVFSKTRQRSSTSKFMARINTVIMYTYMVKILHRVWRSSRLPCTQEWWYPALVALALGEQWWRCQFPPWGGRDRCRGRHNGKRKIDPHAWTIHQTLNEKKALAEMQGARESLSARIMQSILCFPLTWNSVCTPPRQANYMRDCRRVWAWTKQGQGRRGKECASVGKKSRFHRWRTGELYKISRCFFINSVIILCERFVLFKVHWYNTYLG